MILDDGAPSLSTFSRVIPFVSFFRSSAVTCGGGGGGGGGGGRISGIASGAVAAGFAALARWPDAGGGGGTDSGPPGPFTTTAGPTSSSGALLELSSGGLAAFPVALSTLPKIDVIPSLTFFPAALPIAPPATVAPISVIVCAPANPATSTNKIPRIQYLIWQRSTRLRAEPQAKYLMRMSKNSSPPPRCGDV